MTRKSFETNIGKEDFFEISAFNWKEGVLSYEKKIAAKVLKAAVDEDQETVLFKYCLFETEYISVIVDWKRAGIVLR